MTPKLFLLCTFLSLLLPIQLLAQDFSVKATVETTPVSHSGDAADDMAVWVHPNDPSKSVIIGTDKLGGLNVYEQNGSLLQYIAIGRINNVDIRYGMMIGKEPTDIVTGTKREDDSIVVYKINHTTRKLENIAARTIKVGMTKIYGHTMYKSKSSGKIYAISGNMSGSIEQWELFDNGSGKVDAKKVRSLSVATQAEGMVADDELGYLYVAEEDVGIWKFGAEPDSGSARTSVTKIGANGLKSDLEGLAIYYGANNSGYLIASNQGANQYNIYERGGSNKYVTRFNIINGSIDGTNDTDGIDVVSFGLGSLFPNGAFLAQDGTNDNGNQNFKIVPWESIANGSPVPLLIDNKYNPRDVNSLPTGPTDPTPVEVAEILVAEDAMVNQKTPDQNYGSSDTIEADGSPKIEAYLKFNVSALDKVIKSAKVRLYVTDGTTATYQIYSTSSNWSESSINFNNRSARTSEELDAKGTNKIGSYIDYDVTSAVLEKGIYSFVIAGSSSNGIHFSSRTGSNPPKLILELGESTIPPIDGKYEFIASEDATVKKDTPSQNYGNDKSLETDGSPRYEAFLKFNVQGLKGVVSSAKVLLYVIDKSSDGPNIYTSDLNWSESLITYNNRPATTSSKLDGKKAVSTGTYIEYDVTSVVKSDGSYSFVLFQSSTDGVDFNSRSEVHPPKLVITTSL